MCNKSRGLILVSRKPTRHPALNLWPNVPFVARPEFATIMVQHADALIAGADDSDAEGCFQVLFKDIQVPGKYVCSIVTVYWCACTND